ADPGGGAGHGRGLPAGDLRPPARRRVAVDRRDAGGASRRPLRARSHQARLMPRALKPDGPPSLGALTLVGVPLAVALAAPFLLPGFQLLNLSLALIYATAILGLNILTGYSGQISLGH